MASGASDKYSDNCGGMIIMFGCENKGDAAPCQQWPKTLNGKIPCREELRAKFHAERVGKSIRAKGLARTVTE